MFRNLIIKYQEWRGRALDIWSAKSYPANVLSNLCSNGFRFEGVVCGSMEGFLQEGLDILIEAFSRLGDGYQLIIAGEPYGSFDRYRKLIDSSGCGDRIRTYLQYIKDPEVKDFFSVADVAVLPYRSATQSGISSVSYHFEVPMIVTDTGGLREMVGDTGTGLLAESCTPDAVQRKIEEYFSDPAIRENCVRMIRKEKQRLSWQTFCDRLVSFYEQL